MPAPASVGTYHVVASGYQPTVDATLHGELLRRPMDGSGDVSLGSADGALSGQQAPIDLAYPLATSPGACGDQLVARITFVSGRSDYGEFSVTFSIP